MSGLVRAERLFRARRRARRQQVARPALAAAVVTTVLGALLWAGYSSPLLRLSSVTVKGTSRLTVGEVLAAAHVRLGGSLLSVSNDAIRHRVARLAPVADVRVSRSWPHQLVIDVSERTPVAAVTTGVGPDAAETLLDAHGVAFAAVAGSAADPALVDVRVTPPVLGSSTPAAAAALNVWFSLPSSLRQQVLWVSADSADDVTLRLAHLRLDHPGPGHSGKGQPAPERQATVVWGSAADSAEKIAVLNALLRRPATTYDVSTPGIAVTR